MKKQSKPPASFYQPNVRTQKEIDDVLNECIEQDVEGGSKYGSMTYEQGILEFWRWLVGETDENPME